MMVESDLNAGHAGGRRRSLRYGGTVRGTHPAASPADFALGQNYPNPFNPSTVIDFSLPAPARVEVRIFNILGQLVRVLLDQDLPAGSHQVTWDGIDGRGKSVATGVYFYRLETAGHAASKKMVVLK